MGLLWWTIGPSAIAGNYFSLLFIIIMIIVIITFPKNMSQDARGIFPEAWTNIKIYIKSKICFQESPWCCWWCRSTTSARCASRTGRCVVFDLWYTVVKALCNKWLVWWGKGDLWPFFSTEYQDFLKTFPCRSNRWRSKTNGQRSAMRFIFFFYFF